MDADRECPDDVYNVHIVAFVSAFVLRNHRDRWRQLLSMRPKQLLKNSHKLYNHLDKSKCSESSDYAVLAPATVGMFCDFHAASPPLLLTGQRAIELGRGHDALFSIIPGKLAVYFFHEDISIVCRSK